MKYLLDKKIKTPDEMRSRLPSAFDWFVRTEENARKGLDGWLDRMRSRSWGTGDTPENIGNMITAMDLSKVILCVKAMDRGWKRQRMKSAVTQNA